MLLSDRTGCPRRFDSGFHSRLASPPQLSGSSRQRAQWGSCCATDRTIRISDRLKDVPDWILDAVLVHELAHLLVEHHGPAHDELVNRFPYAERARGFLTAKDLSPDDLVEGCDEPPLLAGDIRP